MSRRRLEQMSEPKIEVEYDGEYPNACSGTLTIKVNGEKIYERDFCCHSTGSVSFDDDWTEHVTEGELLWNDGEIDKIPKELQAAVKVAVECRLSEVVVCCGGCV